MQAGAEGARKSAFYTNYVIAVMASVYFMNFLDRSVLGILLPSIREDFQLSDAQIGLLVGTAFGLVYAFLAVPVSALGDRYSRRNVVLGSLLLFSGATFISGFVTQFWQLVLARLAFGAGQAGVQPCINSMLADVVPRERRAAAMAIGSAGGRVGGLMAALIGGLVAAEYGWRTAMIAVGIPGFIIAAIIFLTIREPARGASDNRKDKGVAPPFFETMKTLWACPTYRDVLLASIFLLLTTTSLTIFVPSVLIRSHGVTLRDATFIMTGFSTIAVFTTWGIGWMADRLARKDIRNLLRFPVLLQLTAIPFFILFMLSGDVWLAVLGGIPTLTIGGAAITGPLFATIQNVAPLRVRGRAMGVFVLISGVVGAALGPQAIGIVSDLLKPSVGAADSLRWSIALLGAPTLLVACFFFWRASKTLEADIARAEA